MSYFLICHGLGGSFGGDKADYIMKFKDADEAVDAAYFDAREDYESYEGSYGIRSYADIVEEDYDGEECKDAEEAYEEEIEGWIDYSAKEVYTDLTGKWYFTNSGEMVDISGEGITVWNE